MSGKDVCAQEVIDKCLRHTSGAYQSLNIENGEYYDTLAKKVIEALIDVKDRTVNTSCLFGSSCENADQTEVDEAIQKLYNWACDLSTDNIFLGVNSRLSSRGISACGAKLVNMSMRHSVKPGTDRVNVSWDIDSLIKSLPDDVTVSSVRVKAFGESNEQVSSTKVIDSGATSAAVDISPDRFPLSFEAVVSLRSQCGSIELVNQVPIYPTAGDYNTVCDVRDFGSARSGKQNLTEYYADLEAKISFLLSKIESQDILELGSNEYFDYPGKGVKAAVITHSAEITENRSRIEMIGREKVNYTTCESADCKAETTEVSLQQALDNMYEIICRHETTIQRNEADIAELKQKIEICCES